MNIPDEAVKATAQAIYEEFRIDMGGAWVEWPKFLSDLEGAEQQPFRSKAKFFLEAGAPFLAAHALREFGADLVGFMTPDEELNAREIQVQANDQADALEGK